MEFGEERDGAVVILEPKGALDDAASREFQQKVMALISGGSPRVVVDLRSTRAISAAGLRALLMLSKKLESMDGGLVLCSMSDQVRRAFDVAGFTGMVAIEGSRKAAVGTLSAGEAVARVSDLAAKLLAKKDGSRDGRE